MLMKRLVSFACALLVGATFMVTDAQAQDRTIRGKVSDEGGEALPGATVVVQGTSNGTVTDLNGEYSIAVGGDATSLVFSFVGYKNQVVAVGSRSVVDVSLALDISQLGEVVVVGYGTLEKGNVTGAVTTVDAKSISKIPVPSFDQAVQGQIAGVNIQSASGQPGADVSIRIRGQNSINLSSQPLYVVGWNDYS